MTELEQVLARQPINTSLEPSGAGTIVDGNGRVVCTLNLKALTLSEAWAYAMLFMAAAKNCDGLVAIDREALK